MSVYINMEMPEDSDIIVIYSDGTARKYLSYTKVIIDEAKAIPVPPHERLIDVDKVLDDLAHNLGIRSLDYLTPSERAIVSWFRDAPTIIPAEEGET